MPDGTGLTPELFTPDEMAHWMGVQVSRSRATFLEKQVSARFLDKVELAAWPDPIPDVVCSWAVEYAALHYENPTALSDDRSGETFQRWNPRAREIIVELVAWSKKSRPSTGGPVGNFPPSPAYPDPVEQLRW